MQVYVESIFDCPPERVWDETKRPSLLLEVMKPLAQVAPREPTSFPERWQAGQRVRCFCWIFGFIPIGVRELSFERIDDIRREIQTRESDPLIRRWDHLIRIEATSDGKTRYSDRIELDAGWLTPVVWLWANLFYRHRQRRWRRIVIPRIHAL